MCDYEAAGRIPLRDRQAARAQGRGPALCELLEDYDAINDRVHRAETHVDAMDELAEVALRKQRAAIKDEIARALALADV